MSTLTLSVQNQIASITLNRPERLNSICAEMAAELREVSIQLTNDHRVRAILLRGEGDTFCGGGDLKEFADAGDNLPGHLDSLTLDLHAALTRFVALEVPIVTVVRGSAAGGGMGLVCASDLVVSSAGARFTMAYTRIGLVPDAATSFFLTRLVGLRRSMELVLTNRVLSAQEALEWGIVTEVVPDMDANARGMELASRMAAGPTRSLGLAKRLLLVGLNQSLDSQMALETQTLTRIAALNEAKEGIDAFLTKRKPTFASPTIDPINEA